MTDPKARERAQQVALEIGKLFDGPKPFWASDVADIVLPVLLQVQAEGRLDLIEWVIGVIRSHDNEEFLSQFQMKRAELKAQAGAEGGKR